MLFTWSWKCKNLSIFTRRLFTEFDGYSLFLLSLFFCSSGKASLEDLKLTSSVFSKLREISFALNQCFNVSCHGSLAYLGFSQTFLYGKYLYHQESDALNSIELPYRDH